MFATRVPTAILDELHSLPAKVICLKPAPNSLIPALAGHNVRPDATCTKPTVTATQELYCSPSYHLLPVPPPPRYPTAHPDKPPASPQAPCLPWYPKFPMLSLLPVARQPLSLNRRHDGLGVDAGGKHGVTQRPVFSRLHAQAQEQLVELRLRERQARGVPTCRLL